MSDGLDDPHDPGNPDVGEPDITDILNGLASTRITSGPEVYRRALTAVSALEPLPASRANLPGLARIELRVGGATVQEIASGLLAVGEAVTGAAVSTLAWADQRGAVDITLIEQEQDVTVHSAEGDPVTVRLDAGGVFAQLMADDPVQLLLSMHWFLDRAQRTRRAARPAQQVREEYQQFASGLRQVVTHAAGARQELVLDVQLTIDGRRRVGLKTMHPEAPEKKRRRRRS